MEVQFPIKTEDWHLVIRQPISASIQTKNKDNLIGAIDAYNETYLLLEPSLDKEHFVLEGDYTHIQKANARIGYIYLASEYMVSIITYRSNEYLGEVLSHPVYIWVQTGYLGSISQIILLLLPLNSSRIVDHEQMSKPSSNYHMRRVHKVSICDGIWIDCSWEEHAEVSGIDYLEPVSVGKT